MFELLVPEHVAFPYHKLRVFPLALALNPPDGVGEGEKGEGVGESEEGVGEGDEGVGEEGVGEGVGEERNVCDAAEHCSSRSTTHNMELPAAQSR